MESHQADAMVFVISAVLFVGSVIMCSGFARDALGPDAPGERTRSIDVLRGLAEAGRHLGQRLPALVALIGMVVSRLLFGFFSVANGPVSRVDCRGW